VWIWNTRISHPREEIIQNVDDISCAFHRMLLHPTMGPAFASVFGPLLIIPCGCTFGAGNSPGIYMTHGELRAHLSSTIDFRGARSDLAENLHMPPPCITTRVSLTTPPQPTPAPISTTQSIAVSWAPTSFLGFPTTTVVLQRSIPRSGKSSCFTSLCTLV
jgi:hypothetical protein